MTVLDINFINQQHLWHLLSPSQRIATCQRNILQHCWAQHVACVWPLCCNMLGVVWPVSNLSQQHPTCRNTSQHGGQMHATCCAQQCCDMLRWHVAIIWPELYTTFQILTTFSPKKHKGGDMYVHVYKKHIFLRHKYQNLTIWGLFFFGALWDVPLRSSSSASALKCPSLFLIYRTCAAVTETTESTKDHSLKLRITDFLFVNLALQKMDALYFTPLKSVSGLDAFNRTNKPNTYTCVNIKLSAKHNSVNIGEH